MNAVLKTETVAIEAAAPLEVADPTKNLILVPLSQLLPRRSKRNVRTTPRQSIPELAASIARIGLLQNLLVITAIKAVQRLKHQPLNTALSLERPIAGDEDTYTMLDILTSDASDIDPVDGIIRQEDYEYCHGVIQQELSPFDFRAFMGYVSGRSYQQIAEEMGGNVKSVDNALQRSKRKLRRHIMGKQDMTVSMFRNYLIMQQLILREQDGQVMIADDGQELLELLCESIA